MLPCFDFQEFVSAVERLFPYITLVLPQQTWPAIPTFVKHLSQRVALHIKIASLQKSITMETLSSLVGLLDRYDVLLEEDTVNCKIDFSAFKNIQTHFPSSANLYVISKC